MADPQKTVFISYRRSVSWSTARSIFMDLRANGYDAFMDVASIDSGTFDTVILNQIAARAHFLVILEPGTLERCAEPGDWLRREIEYAIELGRNVVPIMVESFKFDDQVRQYLTGKLSELPRYNALPLVHFYFDQGMQALRDRFLKQPVYGSISPTPRHEEAAVLQKIEAVVDQPKLNGPEAYFNRGLTRYNQGDNAGAIADNTEAIRLNPRYADAYVNRGLARFNLGDIEGAVADYNEAIRLNPRYTLAYVNRGWARHSQGDLDAAIADYDEGLRHNPGYVLAYNNRGWARYSQGDWDMAITDFDEAIRLDSRNALAYNNRGAAYEQKGNNERALADYEAALRIDPQHEYAVGNYDNILKKMGRR